MKRNDMNTLAAQLLASIPSTANREPPLKGCGWMIYWTPPGRQDKLCVGVALQYQGMVVSRLASDEELKQFEGILQRGQIMHITRLLNAVDIRMRSGNLEPPSGIRYGHHRDVAGNSIQSVIDMLWRFGPGLLQPPAPDETIVEKATEYSPKKRHNTKI